MASLEWNKAMAAVLTAGVLASGSGVVSRILYQPHELEEPAYQVAVLTEEGAPDVEAEGPGPQPIAALLATASVEDGQSAVRACTACHAFEQGGPNKVGPVLWDVVGRDIAGVDGFSYSAALESMEGAWDYEALDGFLADPQGWAPGTKMSFAGVRRPEERANIIAYMRSLSDDPEPLPEVPETETAEAVAAVDEGAAPDGAAPEQEGEAAEAGAEAIGPLLAAASPDEGQSVARKCAACHAFEQGGPNKIGPVLWDVVGRDIAAVEGFNYSSALQEMEGVWDYEALDGFLEDPQGWAPGTKMSFAGLRRPEERANLIAYMRSLSDNPQPLPEGG